ncbi:Fc receptor-like protein 3 isoform X1 [Trichechus manatus latirostris]|uniref:Fc receptor-like protein 3 isoform X1 n=1 Tax=Trichechus manatus latirostris TaxID=127582 RepID=A0A2Y9QHW0_TRIMA|nr:Fc receptor-like protein 3 isoform X1 [Trichechus manatus latirostris]XP_023581369.1 Fc receptor-like protein 3 isoform X1 [Trichechus manatus latirostris]XP_023581370.1 Fc receptor-like protein 3 isoform X1 [Trichechus manatus latirostris]XP_023581371.1 Fc receptor-like protein 3 isoform X1 [Trichechus manatus latirostris]XP_023581372.1 Fc receptor-like protein 3 isoform X1 [Trichechus manatus latirostris]
MRLCLLLLLILAPGGEQSGEAPKAMVLLQPTWFPVFKGQTVTLTCKGSHSPALGDTSWYHEKKLLKEDSEELQVEKSGKYKCKTKGSSLSDPMDVVFVSGWLILQASYPVFEGDNVDLRCQGKEDNEIIDRIYYKDKKKLDEYENKKCFTLFSVSRDNGEYYCIASGENAWTLYEWTEHSNHLRIQVQELFSPPKLTARPSKPIEGRPVALKCETWLPPQRSHIQLQFCFFRGSQALGAGWSRSPALQIPTMWTEDSGSYWCEAQTISSTIRKRSLPSQIYVQRIPVSDVNLEVRAPGGQVIEGEDLVLVCSVAKGTGTITFSWHREGRVSLGRKTERSLRAELPVLAVKESDAGRYYCTADNVHGPILSKWIAVIVRVPVSRPVLTLWTPRAQGVVGDVVELHCEAQRGSPPILYRFYHEDVILGNNSAPSGGRVSFNLSLTAEHSGNYSCEADNGLRAQRSHQVTLNVTVPVSHPVLTIRAPSAQAVVGDVVELHCEVQRGSPPILYWFYYEDVILGNSSAPSGGGASFSLTAEHSGNYYCEASNDLETQRSEAVAVNIIVPSRNTAGVVGGLLSILGFAAAAAVLLYYFRTQRKSGGIVTGTPGYRPNESSESSLSRPSGTGPQELELVYRNENPEDSNLLYSQILIIQQAKGNSANSSRLHQEDKEPPVIYSELKKARPEDSPGQADSRDRDHEDATEYYENVPCTSSALDH